MCCFRYQTLSTGAMYGFRNCLNCSKATKMKKKKDRRMQCYNNKIHETRTDGFNSFFHTHYTYSKKKPVEVVAAAKK